MVPPVQCQSIKIWFFGNETCCDIMCLSHFQKMPFMSDSRNFLYGFIAFAFAALLVFFGWGSPIHFLYDGLVYEIGHTVFSWMFGIPAMPIFDFKYGGGYSVPLTGHSIPAQIAVLCTAACGLYYQKDMINPVVMRVAIAFLIAFGLIGFTDFYEDVILFMGHGTTAILGGFMLARGMYGVFLTRREERWLNVFVGTFFILDQLKMCNALLHDVEYQMFYETQKGGHGMGDLTRIANNHLWSQDSVAIFLMLFTIFAAVSIPAAVGWVVKRYEE